MAESKSATLPIFPVREQAGASQLRLVNRPNDSQRIVGGTGFCGIAIQRRSRPIHEPEGKLLGQRPMESYFGTMKIELVHQVRHPTRDAAQRDLFSYIEGYYNRQRLHSVLGYITPEQAERQAA